MATNYISRNFGQFKQGDIVVGTSVPTADFYIAQSTTNNPKKRDLVIFLQDAINYILSNGIPSGQDGTDLPVN
jgi:hypothetical protein